MLPKIVIIGTGSHARRVAHLAHLKGWQVLAFLDENPQAVAPLPDVPIFTLKGWPQAPAIDISFVVAIGQASIRTRLFQQALTLGLRPVNLIHPLAYVAADAKLAAGVVVMAGAVIESQAQVGQGVIVDIGALVDHDAFVGDWLHLKPQTLVSAHQVIPANKP